MVLRAGVVLVAIWIAVAGCVGRVAAESAAAAATIGDPETLAGIQMGNPPWSAELSGLRDRLAAIGLPALPEEGVVFHIHQHLDIFVDGRRVAIPSGAGINDNAGFISPIHVHDDSGIIHVEAPAVQDFTLGQFFDIWGVRFTTDCIGGLCSGGGKALKVWSNGVRVDGDPRRLILRSRQQIVVVFGTRAQEPRSIASRFDFPEGY